MLEVFCDLDTHSFLAHRTGLDRMGDRYQLVSTFSCHLSTPILTVVSRFYLPGCLIGGYLLDKIGRRYTQMAGFFVQGVIGMILGGALGPIQSMFPLFIVIYGELG